MNSNSDVLYWLKKLGNLKPSKKHKKLIEVLLKNMSVTREVLYCDNLTSRERACLLLIANGHTSKEIAVLLDLSERTVFVHRGSIFKKLKCKNMAQAVFEGIRYGYLNNIIDGDFTYRNEQGKT